MTGDFEHDDTQPENEPESSNAGLSTQSHWLPVGLGLLGVILILALVGPRLRDRLFTQPGSADEATVELEQSAPADLEDDASRYAQADADYRARRFEDAWAQFRSVEAYRSAAKAHSEIADAERAVQAAPSSKEAHFKLGTVLARARLLVPAETAFKQAIALDGQYADAHVNLGVVYYQMNRLPDAMREYDAALVINPDDADVHNNKGAVYVQQALQTSPPDDAVLDQALHEFQRAGEIKPDLPQVHFSLGVVYVLQGQSQQAVAEFQQFLELDDGSDPEATSAAHSYLKDLGQESQ